MLLRDIKRITNNLYLIKGKLVVNKNNGWRVEGNLGWGSKNKLSKYLSGLDFYIIRNDKGYEGVICEDTKNKVIRRVSLTELHNQDKLLGLWDMIVGSIGVSSNTVILMNRLLRLLRDSKCKVIKVVVINGKLLVIKDRYILRIYSGDSIYKNIGNYSSLGVVDKGSARLFVVRAKGKYKLIYLVGEGVGIYGVGNLGKLKYSLYNGIIFEYKGRYVLFHIEAGELRYNVVSVNDIVSKDTLGLVHIKFTVLGDSISYIDSEGLGLGLDNYVGYTLGIIGLKTDYSYTGYGLCILRELVFKGDKVIDYSGSLSSRILTLSTS